MRCLLILLLATIAWRPAAAREWPLWDGHESVASYARRVQLPPTETLDLGDGIKLELVLIPAGRFMMGTPEPEKPRVTVAESQVLCAFGAALLFALIVTYWRGRPPGRTLSFSLRGLLLLTTACGLMAGGFARAQLAAREAARHADEMARYLQYSTGEQTHSVTLTRPFYMGQCSVTQAQYEAVTGRNPSHFRGAQLPVEMVSWFEAASFCQRLALLARAMGRKGFDVSLPTEAQWEYSCRAGTRTRYYSGDRDSDVDAMAWYEANSGNATHPVGEKKPNAFGLYDMNGNVWQWCEDAYVQKFEELPAADPCNATGDKRIVRGGSWSCLPQYFGSARRNFYDPAFHWEYYGFRIVVDARAFETQQMPGKK